MPAKTRAERMPRMIPAKMMAMAEERRLAGARSAANGRRMAGVTFETPTRYESASNTRKFEVIERPMVSEVEIATTTRIRGRRRKRSPSGEIRIRPVAYLPGNASVV